MDEPPVEAAAAGQRLDAFLAARAGSRSAAAKLIDAGCVRVDGVRQPKRYVLRGGERVEVLARADAPPAPSAPAPFAVVYEDDHLLVVDKPAGVVVHPGAGRAEGTLAQALAGVAAGGEDASRAGIVHRLDRDTSGLLVVARTEAAHAALQAAIRERSMEREYRALVDGRPGALRGTIDAPLGRDRRARTRMSTDTDAPRPAVTHFVVEEALPRTTLLRVRLQTGRTHQIRAHLQAIGTPVCGDPTYGGRAAGRRLGLERQFLHAARLAFAHPLSGNRVEAVSPLPDDLSRTLTLARAE
jgi:23S rRNA pseudouridine1911/1915/1917 synthase